MDGHATYVDLSRDRAKDVTLGYNTTENFARQRGFEKTIQHRFARAPGSPICPCQCFTPADS